MARSTALGAHPAFTLPQPLLPSARLRSVSFPSQRRSRHYGTRITALPHASVSLDKEAAVKAAKRVYKAAKAEYKARKAEYKALKAELETQQKPDIKDMRVPSVAANPFTADAVAVCEGKSCCRMGADAVAMLLGKQTIRAPCMKMCGGAGPSVRVADGVVKVDLKKAVQDAVPTGVSRPSSPKRPLARSQTNSVLELLGDSLPGNVG